MNNKYYPDDIVAAINNGDLLNIGDVPIELFRDVYNRLKHTGVIWILAFIEDQVIAQPYGKSNVYLIIKKEGNKFITRSDFEFIPDDEVHIFGCSDARYSFKHFVLDVFNKTKIAIIILAELSLYYFFYVYSKSSAIVNVCNGAIQAMAIFITVFVLFVISLNPEVQYKYYKSGRFHKLAQSDKYIGFIGIVSILFSILGLIAASTFDMPAMNIFVFNTSKSFQASFVASALVSAAVSFWLVIGYHFSRRHEMINIEMANITLQKQQQLLIKKLND